MFRSLLSYIFVREFLVQDVLYLQVFDFQIWLCPGFLMQQRQEFIIGFDSAVTLSSTVSFLRSVRHHFKTIDGTEMADVEQTQRMIPIFFGHETFALGAACFFDEEEKETRHRKKRNKRGIILAGKKRVTTSLGDEESVDPNSHKVAV